MTVCFIMPGEDLATLRGLDPDRQWQEFVTGERAWVLQTYLRLHAAGVAVHLTDRLPHHGIAIFSSKQRHHLLAGQRRLRTQALLVAIREDVNSTPFADIELVQNPSQARPDRALLVPLWPQPGLQPRRPERGETLVNIAYRGFAGNLHPSFQDPQWLRGLEQRGLTWQVDAVQYGGPVSHPRASRRGGASHRHGGLAWNDFSETDLIVAVRPDDPAGHPRKPATKLYNAWLAGVPCLLGAELAYRDLRRDPLDYIEVRDSRDATAAIDVLLADRARYAAMIEHACRRAQDYTVAAFVERWRILVTQTLPHLAATSLARRNQGRPLWLRQLLGRLSRARHASSARVRHLLL